MIITVRRIGNSPYIFLNFSSIIGRMGNTTRTIMWINRQWIFKLKDGTIALDWGEGMAQELLSGEFICYAPDEYGHVLLEEEFSSLLDAGRVSTFNREQAAIIAWPPR